MADDDSARTHQQAPEPNPALKARPQHPYRCWEWPGGGYEATMTRVE
jgi:hypothetical protein